MQAPPEHTGSVVYDLAEGSEWRFELDEEEAVAVRVSRERFWFWYAGIASVGWRGGDGVGHCKSIPRTVKEHALMENLLNLFPVSVLLL